MKPMKKRDAITVAAVASLAFGGVAVAAVGNNDATAPSASTNADEVPASDSTQALGEPTVIEVYIDDPSQPFVSTSPESAESVESLADEAALVVESTIPSVTTTTGASASGDHEDEDHEDEDHEDEDHEDGDDD